MRYPDGLGTAGGCSGSGGSGGGTTSATSRTSTISSTGSGSGTVKTELQTGHLARLPADASGTRKIFPHLQLIVMGMGNSGRTTAPAPRY
ncbi:hypothetical protein C1280_37045 [Gemmata obscuriglobus]|uniref:Uncharacterized protein n=1 Tax=Gemmata obscuriglobus TaxID=114 RepID=A0A2Z3HKN5_9BACT|nr:hypothetical protein C1280_37045 [Gemmata obscuriglobus]